MAEEKTNPRTSKAQTRNKRTKQIPVLPLYILLIIMFAVYLLYQHIPIIADISGIAILLSIIAIIAIELINGFNDQGLVRNIIELVIVIVAVFAIWTGMKIALGTQYPIDVVPSCSMLPALQRGDILLLQGVSGTNGINRIKAPIVNITPSSYNSILGIQAANPSPASHIYRTGTPPRSRNTWNRATPSVLRCQLLSRHGSALLVSREQHGAIRLRSRARQICQRIRGKHSHYKCHKDRKHADTGRPQQQHSCIRDNSGRSLLPRG